ncbi:MAG TPA: peptidoglycan DD-metalloendopeptidase family protein [Actinoplanes sp.]|nr:peptidoglycan DD-metalloendopeptidase family protein [Actinoplanes sp.]
MPTQRTLIALTVLTLSLAGCGGDATPPASQGWGSTPSAPASVPAPATVTPHASAALSPTPDSATATRRPSASVTRPRSVRYVFPVEADNVSWHRTHAKYQATDIFADCGVAVLAVTDGVVLEVSLTDRYVKGRPDGPFNGGLSVSILGADGVRYYGSHLSKVQPEIRAGVAVRAGQRLGLVGRTGNANGVCHLHFGISPKCAGTGDWKVRRGVVWPYPYLDSWRRHGTKSPVQEVAAWQQANHCTA